MTDHGAEPADTPSASVTTTGTNPGDDAIESRDEQPTASRAGASQLPPRHTGSGGGVAAAAAATVAAAAPNRMVHAESAREVRFTTRARVCALCRGVRHPSIADDQIAQTHCA